MAIIYSYQTNTNILATDLIIGSSTKVINGKKRNVTKNFEIGSIAEFYNEVSAIAIAGQSNFFFQNNISPGRSPGSISFINGSGTGTLFSNITTLRISKFATSGNIIIDYINTLVGQAIVIAQCDDLNNFGIYKFTSISPVTGDPNFFDIVIESVGAHGSILHDKFYAFAVYPGFVNPDITPVGDTYTFMSPLVNTDDVITINQANDEQDGYLSASDWLTFSRKQEELDGSGFVKVSGTNVFYDITTYYPFPFGLDTEYIKGDGTFGTLPSLDPYLLITTAASTYFPIPTGTTSQYITGDGTLATFPDLTGFVPVTRTITINGITQDLSEDQDWIVGGAGGARTNYTFIATDGQTTFTTVGYVVGQIDVYYNGSKQLPSEYSATNGSTIVFPTGKEAGDEIEVVIWNVSSVDPSTESFETFSKNLKAYPYELNYTGTVLNSIVYTLPSGTVTKTFNYTGTTLTSIVLSGTIPGTILTTKTFTYSGTQLTEVVYS
jgi:hypothetical protein